MAHRNVEDLYPLSPMQKGMMFHCLNEPGSGVYVEQMRIGIEGLSLATFRQAWERTVARHPVLRTAIVGAGRKEPGQVVRHRVELPWSEHDRRSLTPEEQRSWIADFLRRDLAAGFSLDEPCLTRFTLIRTGDDRWEFVWTVHHIVLDGWSGFLVLHDAFRIYEALKRSEEPDLPPVRPFRDYVAWLQRQDLTRAEVYWREKLAGFSEPTVLGAQCGPGETGAGAQEYGSEQLRLSSEMTSRLRRGAAQSRVTLSTLLEGAWALLLGRYSGADDVLFGTVISCRPDELRGADSMVGMLVNTLPFRARLREQEPVGDWLRAMQAELAEQRAYEYAPLWELQRWSEVPAGVPLFESLFVFENQPVTGSHVRADSTLRLDFAPMSSRIGYPLMLLVMPSDELVLRVTYDAQRFDAETVRRMLDHLRKILVALTEAPDRPLSSVTLLDAEERERIITRWNRTERSYPEATLHGLFEAQVDTTPDEPALLCGEQQQTYGELETRANRLAHYLRGLGVGPDVPVAVCVERSLQMVEAVLGILKAGGAYVPLDPGYPADRLAYMQRNARAPVVLVHEATRERVAGSGDAHGAPTVVCLDRDADAIAACPPDRPVAGVRPQHLAYVLYTSGSTGRPKGVAMPHAPLVNLMHWQYERSACGGGTRTLQFAPISFDVSCQELFATLGSGGTLCLISEDQRLDTESLLALLRETPVHRVFMPYVALQQLAEVALQRDLLPHALREVITAGEQLQVTPAIVELFEKLPGCTLDNQYGPTECHVVSALMLDGSPGTWPALPSIGRPVANTRLYVLDERMQPVPIGVAGELYIGGAAPARGYLHDEDLTTQRFIPDPFGDESGARLYRTGDLARFEPGGDVMFLGRADQQVKLRGFRVELGEIESLLMEHAAVQLAIAVIREDRPGDRRLVAYTVADPERRPSSSELRAFLGERVPDYMLPAAFVDLPAAPLTPTGKVDRRALLAEQHAPLELREQFVPPRGPVEEALAEIWSDVLGIAAPGVHDDFFDLGGHSLMATQLVSRIRDVLRVELPLRVLFDHPTIAELAAQVSGSEARLAQAPPLVATPRDGDLSLSFSQKRLWFLDQLGTGTAYNMPWAFRLEGPLDREALAGSIRETVRRHEVLRTRFPASDGKPVQEILPTLNLPLPLIDLSKDPEEERESRLARMYEVEALDPFDLGRGPLIRPTLIRLSATEHVMFLSLHHIIFDGWSIGLLNRELQAHYRRLTTGEVAALPELTVQYADFARWQRDRLQGEFLERHLEYWRAKLAGVSVLELPTDRPRPAVQTYDGASTRLSISPELTRALKTLSLRHGATLAMTLMAAYKCLLHRYCGQDDIAVGAPIANRNHSETEGLLGFFVNSIVLRTDLSGNPSFVELLGRVQQTALEAYEHQDLPFEQLVDELQHERDQSRNPVFQVVFAMQNTPHAELQLPGLEVTPYGGEARTTRFDIELHLRETADGVVGGYCYNRDLFEPKTIERLAERFVTLLSGIVERPEARLSELPILPDWERRTLLEQWNDTSATYAVDGCLHELFERQVAQRPDAVALTFEDRRLTYRELNERANRLAHLLRSRGIGPDVLVGLCFERSVEMVVGILGILKAGGAYLPLDLTNPKERIAFILEDTRVSVLVTESAQLEKLPGHRAQVICLDDDRELIEGQSAENLQGLATTHNLAYVIYTSGSTGKPKGVLIEHGSVARLFTATDAWYGFDSEDVWTLFHSCAFDFSVWELWGALLYGGRLVVVPYWVSRSPEEFYGLLAREHVTVLNQTPSAFRQLMAADALLHERHELALRLVIFGGEALDLRSLKPWFRRHGDEHPQLVNMYGITETTVHVTYRPLRAADADGATGSLIGRPIPDLQVYVLDREMQLVPIGVPGEMYVGGAGVARGYLDRPELTAARFVPDPFHPDPDSRLYRTGDVGRYLPGRDIEYLGRNDEQVKVRAYRIELGEIEAALNADPWVRESVVTLHEQNGDRRLVGYVVPHGEGSSADEGELVDQWRDLYDETYRQEAPQADPTFNIIGWNSSYTSEPIPAGEMREWTEKTVARILAGGPRRVLEIGCGTGLLLFRVAPHCDRYLGTDFSRVALDYVARHLEGCDGWASKIELLQQPAHELQSIEPCGWDTVVLNSVAQYFPSVDYFLKVLEGAVAATATGGRVILGDLRNLRLLEAYHASVQLHRAEPDLGSGELRQRVLQHLAQEEELVLDPAFFLALKQHLPRISHVDIEPKRGTAVNELTKFRYEVTLHVEGEQAGEHDTTGDDMEWVEWQTDRPTLDEIAARLRAERPDVLALRGIANTRTLGDETAASVILRGKNETIAAELRKTVAQRTAAAGIDPSRLCALEQELPYHVSLSWASPSEDGRFDALLTRKDRGACPFPMPRMQAQPWSCYANHPLQAKMTRRMAPKLRDSLESSLPSYMVPSAFVMLESLPLTPNGKVDRRALPQPEWYLTQRRGTYVEPKNDWERRVAEIWAGLLGVDQVGIADNFFDLGGHSLLATQVVSRIRETFDVELQLRQLFDMPTVEELAEHVEGLCWMKQGRPLETTNDTAGREEGLL